VFTVLPAVRRRSISSAELSPGHRPANAHRSAAPSVLKQVVYGIAAREGSAGHRGPGQRHTLITLHHPASRCVRRIGKTKPRPCVGSPETLFSVDAVPAFQGRPLFRPAGRFVAIAPCGYRTKAGALAGFSETIQYALDSPAHHPWPALSGELGTMTRLAASEYSSEQDGPARPA
jgi:hypothetical protein